MEMLRRHLWVVDLAGIALGAVVFGQATATLIGVGVAAAAPRRAPRRRRPAGGRRSEAGASEAGDRRHRRAEHLLLDVRRCAGRRRPAAQARAR